MIISQWRPQVSLLQKQHRPGKQIAPQTDQFVHQTRFASAVLAEAPTATPMMNQFIDLSTYAQKEQQHAGWVLANAIKNKILLNAQQYPKQPGLHSGPRILEIGCSSGTSTIPIARRLVAHDQFRNPAFDRYVAIDIDDQAINLLNGQLAELSKQAPNAAKVKGLVADAMRHQPEDGNPYTHAVMQFSLSHFDAAGKAYLLDHLTQILNLQEVFDRPRDLADRPGILFDKTGYILITDEFLPQYTDAQSEQKALWHHHGAVIFDALIKGNTELAKIETEALYSGLHKIGDFKIPCEEFETMLWDKDLTFRKFKAFPLNPDLTPYNENKPGLTNREKAAIALWKQESDSLFKMACHNPDHSFHPPEALMTRLQKLGETFKTEGLSTLRTTPTPDDVDIDQFSVEPSELHSWYPNEDWGVFTYQVRHSTEIHNAKQLQRALSKTLSNTRSVEEGAQALFKQFGRFEPVVDAIERFSYYSPIHWVSAQGEARPGYRDLKTNPDMAKAWEDKVDFTKAVIDAYWDLCYPPKKPEEKPG